MLYGFDPLWLMFAIPGLLLGLYAQFKLSSAYKKYMRVGVESGQSGAAVAREILDRNGLTDVPVDTFPVNVTTQSLGGVKWNVTRQRSSSSAIGSGGDQSNRASAGTRFRLASDREIGILKQIANLGCRPEGVNLGRKARHGGLILGPKTDDQTPRRAQDASKFPGAVK